MRDNAAQRLHELLAAIKGQPADRAIKDAWAEAIGIDPSDGPMLLTAFAEVALLPGQIRSQLQAIPDLDVDLFMSWEPSVYNALNGVYNLSNVIQAVQATYDNATLLSLRHASHELRTAGRELPAEQLSGLTTDLNELVALIEASTDVPADLRVLLIDLAQEMLRAVRLVKIHGIDGLQKAVERCIGALVVRYPQGVPDEAKSSSVWKRLLKVVSDLGLIIGTASTGYELGSSVVQAISS